MSTQTDILFVRALPSKADNLYARPFVGPDAELLKGLLRSNHVDLNKCAFMNIFSNKISSAQIKSLTNGAWNEWQSFSNRVNQISPNVLVALGEDALRLTTGHEKLNLWRGSLIRSSLNPKLKVYPTYLPAEVQRLQNTNRATLSGDKLILNQNILPIFTADLKRIHDQSVNAYFPVVKEDFATNLQFHTLCARIDALNTLTHIACDIETLPSITGPLLWMIGFAESTTSAFTIPFVRDGTLTFSPKEELIVLGKINRVFRNPNVRIVFCRHQYDLAVLGKYYGLFCDCGKRMCEDVQWLFHSMYPSMPKSLAMLNSLYTWRPYYKGKNLGPENKVNTWTTPYEQEAVYNCRDCCSTLEVFQKLSFEVKSNGRWSTYCTTMNDAPACLDMTIRGVKIDTEKQASLDANFAELIGQKTKELFDLTYEFNPQSSVQVRNLFYGYFGLKPYKKPSTKKETCDQNALLKIAKKGGEPGKAAQILLDLKKSLKLKTTYTQMALSDDQRAHTQYAWVSTWRLGSSTSPFIFRKSKAKIVAAGTNLQNIPKRTPEGYLIRSMFVADDSYVWLSGDYEQIEARLVIYDSEDLDLIDALEKGEDVHWLNAQRVFQFDYAYDPEAIIDIGFGPHTMKFFRTIAKTIKHAVNYRGGSGQLRTTLIKSGIWFSEAHCKRFISQTREANPCLLRWQNNIEQQVRATRTVANYSGDKRYFFGRMNDALIRSAIAFGPQSTGTGRLLQEAMTNTTKIKGFQRLINVHDEINGQIPKEYEAYGARELKRVMEDHELIIKGRSVRIPAEIQTGPNWKDLKVWSEN